jgi:hypothetical protein
MIRDYGHAASLQAAYDGERYDWNAAAPAVTGHSTTEACRVLTKFIVRSMVPLTWKGALSAYPMVRHYDRVRAGVYAGRDDVEAMHRAKAALLCMTAGDVMEPVK